MTPAEELQAAATLLRTTLVSAATDGPWHVVEYDVYTVNTYEFEAGLGTTPNEPDIAGHGFEGGGFSRVCDAQYVAAMHPGVGALLAELLDNYGTHLTATTHPGWQETVGGPALAIARQLLGNQP